MKTEARGKTVKILIILTLITACYLNPISAAWVDADGVGQESISVLNNISLSREPHLILDSLGNPNIAWADDLSGNYEIYFLKWNGSAWVDADGVGQESINISNNSGTSWPPSLYLDNSGNPNIAWADDSSGNYEIYFLKWDGSAWVDADGFGQESINISNNIGDSGIPSLHLDNSGSPHIAWMDDSMVNEKIYYLKWNGSFWVDADGVGQESIIISNDIGLSKGPSLHLDSLGNPHIAWSNEDWTWIGKIYYLKWNGSAWVDADGTGQESINISNTSDASWAPSFRVDNSGNPHVTWMDSTPGYIEIYYLEWNGSAWVDADGVGQEGIDISNTLSGSGFQSLYLNSLGNPHVAWSYNDSGIEEIYYLKWIPDPTLTVTPSLTVSPTETITDTYTITPTVTQTNTLTITETITQTLTLIPTNTLTLTVTLTPESLDLSLKGNFPNPFKFDTSIIYELSTNAEVEIKIFTLSGEIILRETQIQGIIGRNRYVWNGRNKDGAEVSSGIYIYKVIATTDRDERQEAMSRMVCVK